MGVTILYTYGISESSNGPHRRTFEHHRVLSVVTCARGKSHTTPNTGCVTILCKCEISEINPRTCTGTCEHH